MMGICSSDSPQVCRLEVINTGRRRRWSLAEKRRIVEESLRGHRQASATARRHDIPTSLLFKWRKDYGAGRLSEDGAAPSFVPALLMQEDDVPRLDVAEARLGGRMEIVTRCGRRVIVGPDVDAAALARVLGALEGR